MDYGLCIICQKTKPEALRCPALDLNTSKTPDSYGLFLENWELFRNENISVDVCLPITEGTVDNLLHNQAKWHANCRRNVRPDRLLRKQKSSTNAGASTSTGISISQRSETRKRKFMDICLFCQCAASSENILHSFQKVELTEELRKIALDINEYDVLSELSVGDVVANELKYHTPCYVIFKRRGEKSMGAAAGHTEDSCTIKVVEEILLMIEEDLAAGRRYFALKSLYEEMNSRAKLYSIPPMNRTRLKIAILERFSPMLKEEEGFRNEKILVCSEAMKDIVQHTLVSTVPSEDYRVLSKAALICRRDMVKECCYDFQKDSFSAECQKNSVSDRLKYLVGLLLFGSSHASDFENEQATLTIAQLITFNADMKKKNDTPLPVYLGLLVHSKFRSSVLINELSRLGLAINYNRVQYIERQLGQAMLEHFHAENLVCPTEMRKALFTVGAVDNIDHNPSATTSKDSFHGTAISLFQARRHYDDGIKRNINIHAGVPGMLRLPDEFTALPHLLVGLKSVQPSLFGEAVLNMDDELLLNEVIAEEQWSEHVIVQLQNSMDAYSEVKSSWSAYHARNALRAVPCTSGLFPLFNESSTDPRMILHAMQVVKKGTNYLNPGQIPVMTGDQPIYAIKKSLQWSHKSVEDIVVMLGGFHTEKHSLKAIGDIMQGSGWTQALTEAGIYNTGTADGILNAVHVTKARYAHQVTYVALKTLQNEAYKEASTVVEFEEWTKAQCQKPTFAYWILVSSFEAVLFTFVRAHRQGNFDLYVQSLQRLGELFFACDHYHYARWVPVHVEDMKRLPLSIINEFRNGKFTVQRSSKRFSSIAIDQSHEQMNKTLKGSGGIIGLTQDAASIMNWSVCSPEVSKRLEDFKLASGAQAEEDSDFFHHDELVKRQEDFLRDVNNLTEVMRDHGNPFTDQGDELVSLDGQVSEDKQSLSLLEQTGKQQYADYVKEILIDKTKPFDTPIKKNSFRLFKAPKRKPNQPRKVSMFKSNASILGQMYIATQTRKGDIHEFFSHESQKFPPSLAESDEKMYHSRKSDVIDCLQKEVEGTSSSADLQVSPMRFEAVVIDGGALIHSLIPKAEAVTFENYFTKHFLKRIELELRKTQRLDIVWDAYWESSIKGETRDDRGVGVRLKVGPSVRLPKKWSDFLRHPTNKVELFNYLSESSISKLELIQYDFYITNGQTVLHVGPGPEMTETCDHEEADTRMVIHVLHALNEGAKTILVQTVDSDVVVILIHHFHRFDTLSQGCQLLVNFGNGKHNRILNIREMSTALGIQRCIALPLWVALTGCDSTSSMRGRSKRKAFITWKKCGDEVTQTMVELMQQPFMILRLDSVQFNILETFFVAVYGGGAENINDQRQKIFCHRNSNPELIPPTQNALFHHCQRALYQASVWVSANRSEMKAADPLEFGWKKMEKRLVPLWMSIPEVSNVCRELIKCGCQRTCGNACSCKKNRLTCTAL